MPPKPKSPTKGKKGKLSKAEKERLKKEEIEKKAQEEEAARQKAEQEENERLERERVEREERERIEAAESQRHTTEITELKSILEGNRTALVNLRADRIAKAKWLRYMKCDGSPDPTVPSEINTYMNLWKEDDSKNSLDAVLKESKLILSLIEELDQLLEDNNVLSDSTFANHEETILELEMVLASKVDAATYKLLKGAAHTADGETGNLQLVQGNEELRLMLWGNLSKNPRFKSFEFEEEKLSFELPKQLASSDIAVRFIQAKYDHYSHRCRTFRLKKKKVAADEEPPREADEEEVKKDTEQQDEASNDGKQEINKEESVEEEKEKDDGEKDDVVANEPSEPPKTADKSERTDTSSKGDGAQEEFVEDEEEDEEEDYELEDEDTVDLRAYQVLGGVTQFDLLALPPQPKQVKGWIMTQLTSTELQRMPFPASDAGNNKLNLTLSGTIAVGQTLDAKAVASAAAATEILGAPPVGVQLKLPENVLFSEEPQIAYWSEEGKQWRLDGFTDITFNEAEKVLLFKTVKFGPLACIQDKHINMPFQSWELRPLGSNYCKLTIIAAIIEVEIEIKGALCCFSLTPDSEPKPELKSITKIWMTPRELVKSMRLAAVNLFPDKDSNKYVSITEKDESVENATYQQMALTVSHFAYSWSKWNGEANSEKIIVLGCETLKSETISDDMWSLMVVRKDRSFKLKMGEYDEEYSETYAEGTQFHADLYHMVCDLSSEAGLERMKTSDFEFVDALTQILSATRVIVYS